MQIDIEGIVFTERDVVRIAIVEDQADVHQRLAALIDQYFEGNSQRYQITHFSDGDEILENYRADQDLILMDIQMSRLDGMRTAEKIRELDEDVCLVFVTNLANYAIKGYTVQAMDFLLKPINYNMLQHILKKVEKQQARRVTRYIALPTEKGLTRFDVSHLRYVATDGTDGHMLVYHLEEEQLRHRQTMKNAEETLAQCGFCRCNSCYLVNLKFVKSVTKEKVILITGEELGISRSRYKEFMEALMEQLKGGRR